MIPKINPEKRIQSIDFFRGIAALSVLLGHYNNFIPFLERFGGLGVDLFFIISGFLVSKHLIKNLYSNKRISFKDFFLRRVFKIFPSYYAFIAFGYLLSHFLIAPISIDSIFTLKELPQYMFFYRNYGGLPNRWAFEHIWSLCVEEHFYLVLPMGFIIFQNLFPTKKNALTIITGLLILSTIFIKLLFYIFLFAEHPTYTHNRIDGLLWGVFLSLIIQVYKEKYKNVIGNIYVAFAGLILLIFLLVSENYSSKSFFDFFLLHTIAPIAFFLILLGAFNIKSVLLNPFQFVSSYSYNLYLWHFLFVIPITYYFGNTWIGFSIYIIVSWIFAVIFTKFIEVPFLKIRSRVLNSKISRNPATGWE